MKQESLKIFIKKDGVTKEMILIEAPKAKHLCATCHTMLKCPKVMNLGKIEISKYDFIKEGYQIFETIGDSKKDKTHKRLVKFIVSGCSNYVAGKNNRRY